MSSSQTTGSNTDAHRLGRYTLRKRLGTGGMGSVYQATMEGIAGFEKVVALKCLQPHLAQQSPQFTEDLVSEAKLSVLMNHPNIIQVYDLGKVRDIIYVSMEYVRGESLSHILTRYSKAKKDVPLAAALSIVIRICDALDYAHALCSPDGAALNVIHRDVSPENILISYRGGIKLIDFGIAKAATNLERTEPGLVKGKLSYMAPEQLAGMELDQRADVYSTGVVLFETLTRRRLFARPGQKAAGNLLTGEVPPVSKYRRDLPEGLDEIVRKALARPRDERYQTAIELRNALLELQTPVTDQELATMLAMRRFEEARDARPAENPATFGAELGLVFGDEAKAEEEVALVKADTEVSETMIPVVPAKQERPAWLVPMLGVIALLIGVGVYLRTVGADGVPFLNSGTPPASVEPTPPEPLPSNPPPVTDARPRKGKKAKAPAKTTPKAAAAKSSPRKAAPAKKAATQPKPTPPPPKPPSSREPLAIAEIEKAVMRHQNGFQSCIRDNLDAEKTLQGTLFVQFSIERSGRVAQVILSPEKYTGTEMAKCVTRVAKTVRVREHPDAMVKVQFPFEVRVRSR